MSRGIGLELARQALKSGHVVWGTHRGDQAPKACQELQAQFPNSLHLLALALGEDSSIERLVKWTQGMKSLDILINNAGVYKSGESFEDFDESFRVNAVTPFRITQALLPLLSQSSNPKAVQITSLMGSIADNQSGGSAAYRASKCALNMLHRTLWVEHNAWLQLLLIHPGWVKTDMGGENAPTTVEESCQGIWRQILNSTLSSGNTAEGRFIDFEGDALPW